MNRRGFFGTVGAIVVGAVLGRNVDTDPNHASVFIADEMHVGGGTIYWNSQPRYWESTQQLMINTPGRIGLTPIELLAVDSNGAATVRNANGVEVEDFDWYGAWL